MLLPGNFRNVIRNMLYLQDLSATRGSVLDAIQGRASERGPVNSLRRKARPVSSIQPKKHAFISYVHEDSDRADRLCSLLDAANIPYWRDRSELGPGDMWKAEIREAISSGSLAFIACFSKRSCEKEKSYQNEELTLATDEFRLRPPGRSWLIPVRFDDCEIPKWDLGGGRMLADVNYVDLFGDEYAENAVKLIEAIKKAMGLSGIDPVTVRAAVEEANIQDRPLLLRRLTKEMVRETAREIDLDELVSQEVSRVVTAMRDTERFPQQFSGGSTQDEVAVQLAEIATDYWQLVEPFCRSLQVAARWAAPEALGPWINGLRRLAVEAMKPVSGTTSLLDLREVPILASVMVAALASTGQGRWDNFAALLVENRVSDPALQGRRVAIIESVSPWGPFSNAAIVAHVLTRSITTGDDFGAAVAGFNKTYGRFHQPIADWLFALLRPVFDEQFTDDDAFENAFDYAEAALGVVNEDLGNMRNTGETGRPLRFRNMWFGRSTWRFAHRHCDPVADIAEDHAERGSAWRPLRAGLFGGSTDRAKVAIEQYRENFDELASRQW
jgi:TIR domain